MQQHDRRSAMAALWPHNRDVAFVAATASERAVLAQLIPVLLSGPPVEFAQTAGARDLVAQADAAGLALELWRVGTESFWVVRERETARRGAGSYVFRAASASARTRDAAPATAGAGEPNAQADGEPDAQADGEPNAQADTEPDPERAPPRDPADPEREPRPLVILQAPHAYFDRHTKTIAAAMLFATASDRPRPDVLFSNSLHRYQQAPGWRQKTDNNPADACHNPDHLFQHATAIAAEALAEKTTVFIQLHGFAEGGASPTQRQRTGFPDIIVSAGRTDGSSARSAAMAAALQEIFGPSTVQRYPEDIRELGGTTNVQGRLLRKLPNAEFVHLEMSAGLRKQLITDSVRLNAFADAVLAMGE